MKKRGPRTNSDQAEYAALKRRLARHFPHDRAAYTEGKTAFVEAGIERAAALISARTGGRVR